MAEMKMSKGATYPEEDDSDGEAAAANIAKSEHIFPYFQDPQK